MTKKNVQDKGQFYVVDVASIEGQNIPIDNFRFITDSGLTIKLELSGFGVMVSVWDENRPEIESQHTVCKDTATAMRHMANILDGTILPYPFGH